MPSVVSSGGTANCKCRTCGSPFYVHPSQIARGRGKYCSRRCHWSLPPAFRFWTKIEIVENGCWLWTKQTDKDGYGHFAAHGQPVPAHRFAYELIFGPAGKLFVCHECDRNYLPGDFTYRRCVNPLHLWLGTQAENIRDSVQNGRWYHGRPANTRLTTGQVLEIRAMYSAGCSQAVLAETYRIGRDSISRIVNRKRWRDV